MHCFKFYFLCFCVYQHTPPQPASNGGPQLLPDGNDFLYSGSAVKKNDLMLLLTAFVLRFKLSAAACQALLTLIDMILPGCITTTNHFFDKLFNFDNRNVQVHYFCADEKCMNYFGPIVPDSCSSCGCSYRGNSDLCRDSYMFVLPLTEQLTHIFNNDNNLTSLLSKRKQNDELSDIVDGKTYKKHCCGSQVTLQFNCDGAPIFKSSKFSIWPLLCAVNELPMSIRNCNVMMHTLWFGRFKPCVSTFLQPFVSEIIMLYNNGFHFIHTATNVTHTFFVNATLCICDAPARAMVQNFTQFNGAFGCGFCTHPGQRIRKGHGNVQIYPMDQWYPLRTNKQSLKNATKATRMGKPIQGVKGASLLSLLPNFDIVQCLNVDYMHCVLLGVTRQFLNLWTESSSCGRPFYVKNIAALDSILKSIKPPNEIRRLPRTLMDKKFWKASEFKSFLLIYSPVLLMKTLPRQYYRHWLLLCNGIQLLLQEQVTEVMISTSRNCLNKFITLIPELYGWQNVTYNVHILCHLPDTVKNWGPLCCHSAFVFEDVIGSLKRIYHGTQLVPKQIFKYFNAWNKLQSYNSLLLHSDDEVRKLYSNFSGAKKCSFYPLQAGNFTGVRKAARTFLTESQNAVICDLLQVSDLLALNVQSYDRFIINNTVFSTSCYSSKFRRNNSFVLLANGCFADITFCFSIDNCSCNCTHCMCTKYVVLFVDCFLSTSIPRTFDKYTGIDLTQFIRRIKNTTTQTIAVFASDIVSKCISITDGDIRYALQLPKVEIE